MYQGFKGKCALVTGGSSGIGRAIALALAQEGCNVAICARRRDPIDAVVREIEASGARALGLQVDVVNREGVQKTMDALIKAWGTIHVLVNNVGGGGGRVAFPVEKASEELWLEVYTLNTLAAIRFTMLAIPHMRRQKWGRVVTITSLQGHEGGGRPWYNMAKSAETSLMKTLAMNRVLARDGITFNSVAPGPIIAEGNEWDMFQQENLAAFNEMVEQKPLGRLGTPEEVANVVLFICSDKAALLNGASIPVDGGESRSF